MKSDIKTLADSVFTAVTGYLAKALEPIENVQRMVVDQVQRLNTRIDELPIPENGKDGAPGQDGTSVTLQDVEPLIVDALAKALESIPPAKDGIDGKDGLDGKDGQDVDPASVEDFLDKAVTAKVQEAVAAIPPARDGLDGKDGTNGKDGEPGRHALQIDILPAIDESQGYARGTFASHRGGLIHALRATEPVTDTLEKAGWEVIVEGFPIFEIKQDDADPRAFTIKAQRTSGSALTTAFRIPAVIDAGFYQAEKAYREGDGTTFGGSFWIAQKDTDTKPCIGNDDWRLSVRKGRDAKRSN